MKYDIKGLSEFEVLTLREALYKIEFNREIVTEKEFKQLDNKIMECFK